jgi:hypothetical protein
VRRLKLMVSKFKMAYLPPKEAVPFAMQLALLAKAECTGLPPSTSFLQSGRVRSSPAQSPKK